MLPTLRVAAGAGAAGAAVVVTGALVVCRLGVGMADPVAGGVEMAVAGALTDVGVVSRVAG